MNDLLEWIKQADHQVFWWINIGWGSPFLDALLPWCRERWLWAPLYLFVITFGWSYLGRNKGWLMAIGLVLAVGAADFTSSALIKKNVKRIRPCNDIELRDHVRLRIDHCGSGYSFTSSHAANHFAVAVFLTGFYGRVRRWVAPVLLFWASLIALSQVYVGVHFPLDILCGAVVGAFCGWGVYALFSRINIIIP